MLTIDVQSTAVRAISYSLQDRTLIVWFISGGVYKYFDVPESLYEKFLSAQPHPWSVCGKDLRAHQYKKLH